jgi:hypothetical protein
MVKSTRYKEVSDKDMKKKGVKSPLGLKFHIYDCLGLNLIRTVPSPGRSLTYRLPVA